jgi:hypothetical protein
LSSVVSQKGEQMELLTLKQFLKVFEFDKFGELSCEMLKREMEERQRKESIIKAAKLAKKMIAKAFLSQPSDMVNDLNSKRPFRATIAQKIAALQYWFDLAKAGPFDTEVAIESIGQMLVDKRLVPDVDTAIKKMQKLLNSREKVNMMTFTTFQKVFVRAIFKESLIEMIRGI